MWTDQEVVERINDILKRSGVEGNEQLIHRLEGIKNRNMALAMHLSEHHNCTCPGMLLVGMMEGMGRMRKTLGALEAVYYASHLLMLRGGTSHEHTGLQAALLNARKYMIDDPPEGM